MTTKTSDDTPGRGEGRGTQPALEATLAALRPRLHRYCARMTGSAIDGEDVVQETLIKAFEARETHGPALVQAGSVEHLEGWLVRIAHNAALDFLRRRARRDRVLSDEDPDMLIDPAPQATEREAAVASLSTFMQLPTTQRSSVILMDVLGYSLEEISSITGNTVLAVKAALHRGRARLRELAREPDDRPPPVLGDAERSLLAAYIDRFNARDFDALRDMLAEEVQLDLVNRLRRKGRAEVGNYFGNYGRLQGWEAVPGFVERQPALLVRDVDDLARTPRHFILLKWSAARVMLIRDFRYARYVLEGAEVWQTQSGGL
jgi:RNA polymerase sigma-70 factor, ECF subfamily